MLANNPRSTASQTRSDPRIATIVLCLAMLLPVFGAKADKPNPGVRNAIKLLDNEAAAAVRRAVLPATIAVVMPPL